MKYLNIPQSIPLTRKIALILAMAATSLIGFVASATPYASSITNDGSGNMTFYLNEGGANVWITYEDGSTNANYNGITTGVNLNAGAYVFALGAHTTYSINCYKVGTGTATLIKASPAFTPRGIDVNRHPASPYFGRVYASGSSAGGIFALNPDMSFTFGGVRAAGVSWSNNGFSPYRVYVGDDDYLMVGDGSETAAGNTGLNDGVWRLDPNLTTSQLFLGPRGFAAGQGAGVHTTIGSRPVVLGNVQGGGPVTLLDVDADWSPQNTLLIYSNITLATLPYQTAPNIVGPEIGLPIASQTLGGNSYPGLQVGNGYIYAGTYRLNFSNPLLQIYQYDPNSGLISQVFDSRYNGNTKDYFLTTVNGITQGTVDIAISPDGRYVAGVSIDNWFVICPLTNGIPDVANLFTTIPTSTSGNARGLAFDAADNLYLSSSGLGLCQSWSLGITSLATTTGNASGSTAFSVNFPSTSVSVAATTPNASQGGSDGTVGTPVPGVFTITRTNANNDYSQPMTVNFTFGGTASNSVYTTDPSTGIIPATNGSVTMPAGVSQTNVSIIPSTANVPRLTTTVILSVSGGSSYSVAQPSSATVLIQNTSTNQLVVSARAATMYKAFSNDFASATITRLGDSNVTVSTAPFTYTGTAVAGTDFTPATALTFNPGDITHVATISPLSNGVAPVNVTGGLYVGNKSVTLALPAGTGYQTVGANSTTLTLIDNALPPESVLFADPLTDPNDAAHWNITFGSADEVNHAADYTVEFGYDLTANNPESFNNGLIGLPPSGATNALRITCVKNVSQSFAGGVNVYYTNQAFSGNYAVRFNMNLIEGNNGTFGVEGAMFGINHNGIETNWWLGGGAIQPGSGPWAADGVWYWIQSPPGGIGGFGFTEFEEYTGAGGALPNTGWLNVANVASLPNVYKRAVYSAPPGTAGGTPANNSPFSITPADDSWSDVEIKQVNKVVTMSVNKTAIFVYTNTTSFTNGYLMLGYNCPLQGAFNQYIGTPDAAAYFSNLRVVSLTKPLITSITSTPSGANHNVTILFTSSDADDTAASFALQGATAVSGPYADVTATITQIPQNNGTAVFQATTTSTAPNQFYRIRHK